MSTQQTDSVELDIAIAADSPAPSESLATSIPPELFKNVLAYVGDEYLLVNRDILDTTSPNHVSAIAGRRDEMRHLSVCASTCVYWAQLTRERMFRFLILRSSKDMSGLLSFLRAPQSPRIPHICDIFRYLDVFYTLGDHPWFHSLADLRSRYRISNLAWLSLYITGPATPAFVAASTRGSVLHPLFFATPRVLPVTLLEGCNSIVDIQNIHLPNPTMLSHLLQDCLSLRPLRIACTTLTWDIDPVLQATPSSIGLKYACRTADGYSNNVSRCTDDVLVAAMLKSVPHREFSQQRQGPHLDPLETSYLFDATRTTWCGLELELQRREIFKIVSGSDPDSIQEYAAMRLPAATDFCLKWEVGEFIFRCIASRLPHAPATSNNVRNITYIIIDLCYLDDCHELRGYMKIANINWDTFLHTVRQLPHLRQIEIHWTGDSYSFSYQISVEFLAHLGEAWFGLGGLLGLYYRGWRGPEWIQLRLDTTVMDEIKKTREGIKAEADAEKAASSELESNAVAEGSESSAHTGYD